MAVIGRSKESLLEIFQSNKSRRLNELRKENKFCDLTLRSEDGVEIRVHKVVLSAASNYFKDLLTTPLADEHDGCELPDITSVVLEKIISFIYTNEFDEEVEDLEKIINYAAIYQLEELVEICSPVLYESISDHTCLRYWRFCKDNEIYHGLQDKCLAYIVDEFDNLIENSFLNDLTIEEMRYLLAEDMLRLQYDEEEIFELVWKWAANKVSDTQNFFEVFSEVVDLFRFSHLKEEFICSKIFCNENISENGELLKKISKLTKKQKFQDKDESSSNVLFPKPILQRLLALGSNKMFTGLEEWSTTQIEEKQLPTHFGCTTFDKNSLLICGGRDSTSCEYLDPVTQEWRKFPSMKSVKSRHSCSYLDNKIYACGSCERETRRTVEIFDLGQEKWYNGPEMISENFDFGLTTVNGALYAMGGISDIVQVLDPRTEQWSFVCVVFSRKICCTRCVSIGPCIHCFTNYERCIFDTRMNKFAEVVSFTDFNRNFSCCELNNYIYGFGYEFGFMKKKTLKLVQYQLNGRRGYTKSMGNIKNIQENFSPALVALYY